MDPSALKWHDWVQVNGKKQVDVERSPSIAPLAPPITPTSPKAQPQQQAHYSNRTMCAKPTPEELKEMMPDPIRCFCNEEAHLLHLQKVGPVHVCYRWAHAHDAVMCGFHMHQDGWLQFRKELEQGLPLTLDHAGVKTCKHFNFSFCTYFFVVNSFPKLIDNGPSCFCNKPLFDHHSRTSTGSFDFTLRCDKMYTHHRRCNFSLPARNACFLKSTCQPILNQSQINKKEEKMRERIHQHDLLSALLDTNGQQQQQTPQKWDYWDDDKMDTYSSGDSSLSPKSQATLSPILSHRHPPPFQPTTSISNTTTTTSVSLKKKNTTPASTPSSDTTLDLYEIREQELRLAKAKHSLSSSTTSSSASSPPLLSEFIVADDDWETEKQQLKVEMDRLRQEINQQDRNTDYISFRGQSQEKLQKTLAKNQHEHHNLVHRAGKLDLKRSKRQGKLAKLEFYLSTCKDKEREEGYEKSKPRGEDFKCKLCFNRYIEYALIPCYHLAYCETCANRLKECAICRKPVTTKIKINMC